MQIPTDGLRCIFGTSGLHYRTHYYDPKTALVTCYSFRNYKQLSNLKEGSILILKNSQILTKSIQKASNVKNICKLNIHSELLQHALHSINVHNKEISAEEN